MSNIDNNLKHSSCNSNELILKSHTKVAFELLKTYIIVLFVLIMPYQLQAQKIVKLNQVANSKPALEIISQNDTAVLVSFSLDTYKMNSVVTQRGKAYTISIDGGVSLLDKGAPDVPKFVKSFIVPDDADMQLEIVSSKYIDEYDIDIAPSKGNIKRKDDPSKNPYIYGDAYNNDEFFPQQIVNNSKPYIFRDYKGQTVSVCPVSYNPVRKVLRVYTEIVLRVKFIKSKIVLNEKEEVQKTFIVEFNKIYESHFINYGNQKCHKRYAQVEEHGNMLIISHGLFINAMQDFVNWKKQKGIQTEIVDIAEIGGAAAIKEYVADYYDNYGLTFLLLVGDAEHVPPLYKSGDSDAAYGHILGNDSYAEVIVGRFSAQNIADVQTQVQRTISYEKYPQENADWYRKYTLIASNEGPGDDNEFDFEHLLNIKTALIDYTYTVGDEFFDGSHGGNDASGDPTNTMLTNALEEGRGMLNYIGHGDYSSFLTTGFSCNNVYALKNENKLPFIFDVACENGDFKGKKCMAECWLTANYNSNPTGAIAVFASTIEQDWNPPMAAQDEMIEILTESKADNIKRTFGGITINGCMLMNDEYGSVGANMTNTWTIFGDPSLCIRTDIPQHIKDVSFPSVIKLGCSQIEVFCSVKDAQVSLSRDGNILGVGTVNNGSTFIEFKQLEETDDLTLTITAYNKIPFISDIQVIPSDNAFLILNTVSINDDLGNANGHADFNEEISFDIEAKNFGNTDAIDISASLLSIDPYITIIDNEVSLGTISANTTLSLYEIFKVKISDTVPDEHIVEFELIFTNKNGDKWKQKINVNIFAPKLQLNYVGINDYSGNNNNRLEADETVEVYVEVKNTGHYATEQLICSFNSLQDEIVIHQNYAFIDLLPAGSSYIYTFSLSVLPTLINGLNADFNFKLIDTKRSDIINMVINEKINLIVEDWESNDFYTHQWRLSGNKLWTIDNNQSFDGEYSVKSGAITHNEKSDLSILLFVLRDDSLSFSKKISSEKNFDLLEFYIDDQLMDTWSGEIDWSEEKYMVTSGSHIFLWRYKKDGLIDNGYNCAFIDNINLPIYDKTGNNTPVFTSVPKTNIESDSTYIYIIKVTDIDADNLITISCLEKPDWLSFYDNGDGTAVLKGDLNDTYNSDNNVVLQATDGVAIIKQEFLITVGYKQEDWESNSFLSYNWQLSGNNNWSISDTEYFGGQFSAKTAVITHSEETICSFEAYFFSNDIISFYKKVSSEANYDYLNFYIDDALQGKWSGEIDWSKESFYITQGKHTIKWIYSKDKMQTGGKDCAWIDNIILPRFSYIPTFISQSDKIVDVDSLYKYEIHVNDLDVDDSLIIKCNTEVSWLSLERINNNYALLYGTPNELNKGLHKVELEVSDGKSLSTQSFTIAVGMPIEDWENNLDNNFDWSMQGNSQWIINDKNSYSGLYSLKSGKISHSETSKLSIDLLVDKSDTIYFYRKVSCEKDYDFLGFYIDSILNEKWSGETDWVFEKCFIPKGKHTISWQYIKDGMISHGDDCAYIDYIIFPEYITRNNKPQFISMPDMVTQENVLYEYNIEVSDSNINDIVDIYCIDCPSWLNLTDNKDRTATLSGIPFNEDVGNNNIVLGTSDGYFSFVQQQYLLDVVAMTEVQDDNILEAAFKIIPNPVSETFLVEIKLPSATIVDIKIYNMSGVAILNLKNKVFLTKGRHSIFCNNLLTSGFYLCHLLGENISIYETFIIVK